MGISTLSWNRLIANTPPQGQVSIKKRKENKERKEKEGGK
jgi:hypothetical protein